MTATFEGSAAPDRGTDGGIGTAGLGLRRVVPEPDGRVVLPQAATRLDPHLPLGDDEVEVAVQRLNLDAASFRQLRETSADPDELRRRVLAIIAERGKMQNPVTGSGGMLIGTVRAVGPAATAPVRAGDRIATLVSLTVTPLRVDDGLCRWDATSEQVPTTGTAYLHGRTIVAALPDELPDETALAVLDVCGAPALVAATLREHRSTGRGTTTLVIGGAGKSGSLSLVAAREAGAQRVVAVVRDTAEADRVRELGVADAVVVADATDPVGMAQAVGAAHAIADLVVVCVDAPGAEHGAILATRPGGTIVFFSMATDFARAALGAEALVADVWMIIGNGYTPGHAELALDLVRRHDALRRAFTHGPDPSTAD